MKLIWQIVKILLIVITILMEVTTILMDVIIILMEVIMILIITILWKKVQKNIIKMKIKKIMKILEINSLKIIAAWVKRVEI